MSKRKKYVYDIVNYEDELVGKFEFSQKPKINDMIHYNGLVMKLAQIKGDKALILPALKLMVEISSRFEFRMLEYKIIHEAPTEFTTKFYDLDLKQEVNWFIEGTPGPEDLIKLQECTDGEVVGYYKVFPDEIALEIAPNYKVNTADLEEAPIPIGKVCMGEVVNWRNVNSDEFREYIASLSIRC